MKYTICHFLVLSLSGFGNRVMLALWNELRNIPFFLYLWGVCIKLVWVLPSVFLFLFLFSFLKSFIKIFLIYFFYWRIIALQNFVFFFFLSNLNLNQPYIPSLLNIPPHPIPPSVFDRIFQWNKSSKPSVFFRERFW